MLRRLGVFRWRRQVRGSGLQKHNQKSKSQNQSREETGNLRIDGSE